MALKCTAPTIGGTSTKTFTCANFLSGISFYIDDATYSYVKNPIIDAGIERINFNVKPRYKPRIIFPLDSFININPVSYTPLTDVVVVVVV